MRVTIHMFINREPPIESNAKTQDLGAVQPFCGYQYRIAFMKNGLNAPWPHFCEPGVTISDEEQLLLRVSGKTRYTVEERGRGAYVAPARVDVWAHVHIAFRRE
jgi:hypothetical protein